MEPGKFYLFACPFYFTFVGRFVRKLDFQELVIEDAGYFTRTGATFDVLCRDGMVETSQFHPCDGQLFIPAQGPKFPWFAATPWVRAQAPAPAERRPRMK